MPPKPETTTQAEDPLEKASATKEAKSGSSESATAGELKGDAALDAIGGDDEDDKLAEETSAADDPLEEAEAVKET